jgi:hypothetical protein
MRSIVSDDFTPAEGMVDCGSHTHTIGPKDPTLVAIGWGSITKIPAFARRRINSSPTRPSSSRRQTMDYPALLVLAGATLEGVPAELAEHLSPPPPSNRSLPARR